MIDFPSLIVSNEPRSNTMWAHRWRAYCELLERAKRDADYGLLLDVYDNLAISEAPGPFQQSLTEGVRDLLATTSATTGFAEVKRVCQRLSSNGFDTDADGHSLNEGATCLSIYALTALMNHSCDPSCELAPGKVAQARLHTRARRRIEPGEELCFNYGPPLLLDSSVGDRRDFMLRHHYFVCSCRRCVSEAQSGSTVAL